MVSQAFSASANVLKGDPPTLMAGLLRLMGRQEATKPGCPWRPFRLSLLITNEKSRSVALHISSSSDAGATRLKCRAITPPSRPRSASKSDLSRLLAEGEDSTLFMFDRSWSGKICSPHQAAQFAWFATLVCKWRPTIRDAIDGMTRHAPDRVQSSSSARMAGNTQLVC